MAKKQNPNFEYLKSFFKIRKQKNYICKAPFVSLSLGINGFVAPCCYINSSVFFYLKNKDFYPSEKLINIWEGGKFQEYRSIIKKNHLPEECAVCKTEILSGEFRSNKSKMYDKYKIQSKYPSVIEITIDNACNLSCIMCSSIHSSQIARQRNVNYSERIQKDLFLNEIYEFLPHLEEVIISGGEPFFSELGLGLMKEIVKINPQCIISVNTNGTILTKEIKELMKNGNFLINLSLDSINKKTYEKIRIGANFEKVMANYSYFVEHSEHNNKEVTIAVCPLIMNYKELPEIVEFCNKNNTFIKFVNVFNAHDVALSSSDHSVLEDAVNIYESKVFSLNNTIEIQNANQFSILVNDVKKWKDFALIKQSFVMNLIIDDEKFNGKSKNREQKMKFFIQKTNSQNFEKDLFTEWKMKKDKLFNELPQYFKNEIFYIQLFNMSNEILFYYILNIPDEELIQYFITFGDEIIKNQTIGLSE